MGIIPYLCPVLEYRQMEAKESMIAPYGNAMIPRLRSFIVDRIEEESRMSSSLFNSGDYGRFSTQQ